MMNANLIKEIEKRYEKRKRAKREYDNIYTLSTKRQDERPYISLSAKTDNQTVRLLDEGMVVDANGNPLFYIMKGALETFYNNLPDDYVGSINIGHLEFASFPFLVGEWRKKDLTLVDIGDGRKGLDVKLKLDENSIFVKELRRMSYTVGVSAEFFYTPDYRASELMRIEALKNIEIKDFAIVGEAGNVQSGGIKLKGETDMENILEKLFSKYLKKDNVEDKKKEKIDPAADKPAAKDTEEDEQLLKAAEGLEEVLEQHAQALSLVELLDTELEATKAKLAAAEAKLADNGAAADKVLTKFKELVAKYGTEQKQKKEQLEKKERSCDELSEDGLGVL